MGAINSLLVASLLCVWGEVVCGMVVRVAFRNLRGVHGNPDGDRGHD